MTTNLSTTAKDCRHWLRKGNCFYGDKCRFAHIPEKRNSYINTRKIRKNGHLKQNKISRDCQNSHFRYWLIGIF